MEYQCVGPFHKRLLRRVFQLKVEKLGKLRSRAPFDLASFSALISAFLDFCVDLLTWWNDPVRDALAKFHRMAKACDDLAVLLARAFRVIALKETAVSGFSRPCPPLPKETDLGSHVSRIAFESKCFLEDRLKTFPSKFPMNQGFFLPSEGVVDLGGQADENSIADFISCCSECITRTALVFHPVISPTFWPRELTSEVLDPVAFFLEQRTAELFKIMCEDMTAFLDFGWVSEEKTVFAEAFQEVRLCLSELNSSTGNPFEEPSNSPNLLTKSRVCLQSVDIDLNSLQTRAFVSNPPEDDTDARSQVSYRKLDGSSRITSRLARGEDEEYECYVRAEGALDSKIRRGGVYEEKLCVQSVQEVLTELHPFLVSRAEDWAKREKAAAGRGENNALPS